MIKEAARYAWQVLPGSVRLKIIRVTQQKFTVSAAAVIFNARNEVLLLNHVLRPFSGWGLPGGFIDRGEQPDAAVRREILEETGLEIENLRMLMVRVRGTHVETLFAATASGEAEVRSREILELGWFSVDAVPRDFPSGQHDLIKKVLNGEI